MGSKTEFGIPKTKNQNKNLNMFNKHFLYYNSIPIWLFVYYIYMNIDGVGGFSPPSSYDFALRPQSLMVCSGAREEFKKVQKVHRKNVQKYFYF